MISSLIGSALAASATIARGQEIKRQKEAEAAQLEQERFQRKIQTMEAHNDILDQYDDAVETNESLFAFMNRDDDNSLRAFRESQEALAGEDTKRIDFKGVAEREQLRLRRLSALRAGDAALRASQISAAWTFNGGGEIQSGEELLCQSGLEFDDGTPIGNSIAFCGNATETQEVSSRSPNTFLMYDMGGNVWEWAHDEYVDDLGNGVETDPVGVGNGSWVIRGGSYLSKPRDVRSATRDEENAARDDLGFRLVISQ